MPCRCRHLPAKDVSESGWHRNRSFPGQIAPGIDLAETQLHGSRINWSEVVRQPALKGPKRCDLQCTDSILSRPDGTFPMPSSIVPASAAHRAPGTAVRHPARQARRCRLATGRPGAGDPGRYPGEHVGAADTRDAPTAGCHPGPVANRHPTGCHRRSASPATLADAEAVGVQGHPRHVGGGITTATGTTTDQWRQGLPPAAGDKRGR